MRILLVLAAFLMLGALACESEPTPAPTATAVPTSTPMPAPPSTAEPGTYDPLGPDRDCSDFATQREAQRFYLAAGGPGQDRHRLDGDRDGIACERLP